MTNKSATTVNPNKTEQETGNTPPPATPPNSGPFSVLSLRDYRFLVLANLLTFAGYQIRNMGQAWIVLEETGSETLMGLVNMMPGVAIILISLVGGALADRTERWQLLWRTKVVIASMALLTAVLLSADLLKWWHLIPISLVTGSMFALHNPTSQAFAVDVVGKERLTSASSLNTGISMSANIVGPSLGGLLLILGFDTTFYVLTAFYGVSAVFIYLVRTRRVPVPSGRNMFQEIGEGVSYAIHSPVIRGLLFVALSALFLGMNQPAIPVKVRDELGMGEFGYGVMISLNGVGALIGSAVLFTLGSKARKGLLLMSGMTIFNVSLIIFAIASTPFMTGFSMVLLGTAFSAWMISVPVLLQTNTEENMRGRIMSLYFMTVLTHQIGWLLGGALIEVTDIRTTLFVAVAGGTTISGLAFILTPALRKAR
ncbi:MAG: MFS transporter [Dehalococcoidia bacterium]